ncbi:DoxX family membrane protein [Flavobacterium sp. MK4S-17]|uniref:DoxX family membrane protein n=1 Tax=Flavobacterium sp. MK4S-17 TaxID=2543737 RepID=UPI001F422292|nr:DoxX family membrane protein [Flavobacterium sp. MK4S-17]
MKPLPYLLLRLLLGISFFGHGLVRLPKLNMFSGWMVKTFENSMLPQALVLPFSYMLPFAELITGALLLIGLLTPVCAYSRCLHCYYTHIRLLPYRRMGVNTQPVAAWRYGCIIIKFYSGKHNLCRL